MYYSSSIISVVILVLDIIALVSVLGGRGSFQHKLLWTILVLVLPLIGMILYFLVGKRASDA